MNVGCGPGSGSGASVAAATSGEGSPAALDPAPAGPPPPPQEVASSIAKPAEAAYARLKVMYRKYTADFHRGEGLAACPPPGV